MNKVKSDIKICVAYSSGGHGQQALQLTELYNKYDFFYFIKKDEINMTKKLGARHYYNYTLETYINRSKMSYLVWPVTFILFSLNFIKSIYVFLMEKPDFVISTGSSSALPICIICKLFGKKVVWIESFAKVNKPGRASKLAYYISDLFIIQWKELEKFYPKAVYGGSIY
ncbi:PssD/Cps14F family polysaccharide biosynthesis glycosyltransferase [Natronogracilivirga saccharolytica]|uniref:Polysaccharide biosynthesis protein n=1 Tax=Natronogracilivirga saccharolytica TaxID=2812953 RepID=A0A8J7RMB6_9BACT|nr:PssD/Cps14F family polysaccharide biosynthesis glycosyltransferase [Natronogracilivirga saccharolytica]MBP3194017.1 polysaccharide biosynthesis protein [Natronogracilivirga saccharolytica]